MKPTRVSLLVVVLFLSASLSSAQDSLNVRRVGEIAIPWGGIAQNVEISGHYAYVAAGNSGMRIIDISNPALPVETGYTAVADGGWDIAIEGNYAYVANGQTGFQIVNISNPVSPYGVGLYNTPGHARGIAVAGDFAYVADSQEGLRIFNVSNPSSPVFVGFYVNSFNDWSFRNVAISGDYAFAALGSDRLLIIDVSEPVSPTVVNHFASTTFFVDRITVAGDYAYLSNNNGSLGDVRIVDISNPESPSEIAIISVPGAQGLKVSGDFAFIAEGVAGFRIVNISNPDTPVEMGFYTTPHNAYDVAVAGTIVVVGEGSYLGIYDCSEAMEVPRHEPDVMPQTVTLYPSYPNPFNPSTTIAFDLPVASRVSLVVHNLTGQVVETLVNGPMTSGRHSFTFDAGRLPSGLYFYRMDAADFNAVKKMVLMK